MNIKIIDKKLDEIKADIKIVLVVDKNLNHKWINDKEELEFLGFKGESEECIRVGKTIYVGCENLEADEIRLACSTALKSLKSLYSFISIKSTKASNGSLFSSFIIFAFAIP